jgi:hypothetical protein
MWVDHEVLFWKTPLESGTICFTGDETRCEALTGGLGFLCAVNREQSRFLRRRLVRTNPVMRGPDSFRADTKVPIDTIV